MHEVRTTTCSRDCPDACRILVDVDDGRAVRLRGDPDDPITRGFLCERTNRFLDRQYAPDRFTRPMLRRHGHLEPIEWDRALDLAAEKLLEARRDHGASSILHYRSGGSLGILKHLTDLLFERFGPVTIKRGDICSGAGEAAQEADFGISESNDIEHLLTSRTIVLWGKNPHTSSPHLLPYLHRARHAGATIVGIDPVRTGATRLCDLFLQPRPGADYAVAMAIAQWLFANDAVDPDAAEFCENLAEFRALAEARSIDQWAAAADVPPADLAAVAEAYGSRRPAAILIGWGMGRRRNGSATIRAVDALAAISGNLGVAGGGASYYYRRRAAFDADLVRGVDAAPRTFAETLLGREILAAEPPVDVAWVTAGNPVSMLPDSATVRRAFESIPFTVVVDTHPTDTTDVADLVLPTLTLLEDDDLIGAYGHHLLRASTRAIEPPVEARHELHIMQALAQRLELGDALEGSIDDWQDRLTRRLRQAGVDRRRLEREPVRNPFADGVLFEGRTFPTPSGKACLLDRAPDPPARGDDRYPLTLLATSVPRAQASQWAGGPPPGPSEARVHPRAAAGFADGAPGVLESAVGRLAVTVKLDDQMRDDIILLAKGGMLRDGQCANLLVHAVETDAGGGAAYYDQPVRLIPG